MVRCWLLDWQIREWKYKKVRNNEKRKLTINELIEMAGLDPDEIQIIWELEINLQQL